MAIITERDLIPAAAYIRMSTDLQADSPARQRMQIEDYANRNGYKVIRWYQDSGMTGTESRNRGDYQQLLKDASLGAFTAVLVAELSRMSREDLFSVIPQWGAFHKAGVTLVSCQRGTIDFNSIGGILMAIIDQHQAHSEVKTLADRTVSGKIKAALEGRKFGPSLLGYDRKIVDAGGNVLKIVRHTETFRKSPDMRSLFIPSENLEHVKAVQWAFKSALNGKSVLSIARELRKNGIVTRYRKPMTASGVYRILKNPAYMGVCRFGNECFGKFRRVTDTHEMIVIENAHPALIDKKTFERVNAMLDVKALKRDKWRPYLLTGLIRCGHCGRGMHGGKASTNPTAYYICQYKRGYIDGDPCEGAPMVRCDVLDRIVLQAWCDVFLVDDITSQLKQRPAEDQPMIEREQLKVVQEQIARAEKNLLLAEDTDDFKVVSNGLKVLRKQEAALRDAVGKVDCKTMELSPDISEEIAMLKKRRRLLDRWPNVGTPEQKDKLTRLLSKLLKQTIGVIKIKNDIVQFKSAKGPVKIKSGFLSFNSACTGAPDVELTEEMLTHRRYVRRLRIVNCLREAGRPLSSNELLDRLENPDDPIRRNAWSMNFRRCAEEGMITQTEAGWVPCG